MTDDMWYNKGCLQEMAQMLIKPQKPGLCQQGPRDHAVGEMEAVQKRASKLKKLQQRAVCAQSG
jgi:hypothetical protein